MKWDFIAFIVFAVFTLSCIVITSSVQYGRNIEAIKNCNVIHLSAVKAADGGYICVKESK